MVASTCAHNKGRSEVKRKGRKTGGCRVCEGDGGQGRRAEGVPGVRG